MTQKVRFKNLEQFGFGPNVMRKTKICIKCNQIVGFPAKICPQCGEKMPKETLFDRYKRKHISCPDCDTVLAADSKFCPNCGKAVMKNAVSKPEND